MAPSAHDTIVITGIGILSGLGIGIEENWTSIRKGRSAIVRTDRFQNETKGDILFGKCREFDLKTHFGDLPAPWPLYYSQLALMACKLAIEDAALSIRETDTTRLGLIINSDLGAGVAAENYALKLYGKGPDRVSPFEFTKSVSNCAVGDVARYFHITGPSSFIIGENPLAYGYDLITSGRADMVICGGFDELRPRIVEGYWRRRMLLDLPDGIDDPEPLNAAIRGDGRSDVLVTGEVSCFVVLESHSHAQKRGATIYAEMVDYWTSYDPLSNDSFCQRSNDHLEFNWRNLLQRTTLSPEDVRLLVMSSTLPAQIRLHEVPVISKIWGNRPVSCTTVKSRMGEAFSGGVTASAAMGAYALFTSCLPGTGLCDNFLQDLPFSVSIPSSCKPVPAADRYCLINSLQHGGNNTSILLKKRVHDAI